MCLKATETVDSGTQFDAVFARLLHDQQQQHSASVKPRAGRGERTDRISLMRLQIGTFIYATTSNTVLYSQMATSR